MKNNKIVSKDSEYFGDGDEYIKLESCNSGGNACHLQMEFMNGKMLMARKLIEKKDYVNALAEIRKAHQSTFDLKNEQCLRCADLFRHTILQTLENVITDLRKMTRGLFANKNYRYDLAEAEKLLELLNQNTR